MYTIDIQGQVFSVNRVNTSVQESVNTERVTFSFDASWSGLQVFAAFRNDALEGEYHILLDESLTCLVPWEVYKAPGNLQMGALGLSGDVLVKPTIWCTVSKVVEGVKPEGLTPEEATPTALEQMIALTQKAQDIAQGVRDDAEAGEFSGPVKAGTGEGSAQTGFATQAIGDLSFAQGYMTIAKGAQSHAEGHHTIAGSKFQHVDGKFNVEDTANKFAQITGCGAGYSSRKNIRTMDWYGNVEHAGDVVAMGCGGKNPVSLAEVNNKFEWKLLAETAIEEPTTHLLLDLGAPITDWYSETLIHLQAPKNADNTTSLYPVIQVGTTKEDAESVTNYPPYLCNGQGISLSNKYDLNVLFKTLWLDRKRALYTEHIYANYDSIAYAVHNFVSINMFDRNEWYAQGKQFISIRDAQKQYIFPEGTVVRIYGRG